MIPEKKSESIINFLPPKVKKAIAGGMVAASLATGCNVLVGVPASEKPVEVSTGIPDKEPEKNVDPTQADYEIIPTEKATETVINPTPTYTVEASGGEFTLVQDELNQSEEALVQQNRIQRWLDYWVKFDNRPFAEESADIHWKYIYDNAKDPKEVLVLLEVGGEYNDSLFTVPMNEEGFVDFPPPVEGDNIEAGLGPLEIDPNKDGTILSVKDGVLVRKNSEGEVVEKLVKAQWEKVSLIEGNIFYDPQSKEDFKNVVLAPSPIDEPEMFAKWQDEYLNQVYDKLETYTGPTISDEYTGIDYNFGRISFISSDWPVISSYKFRMGNEEILTKTFVYMDRRNGELIPLSFTYPPEDSYFFEGYKTVNEPCRLAVQFFYGDEMKQFLPDDSMDRLLEDTLEENHYSSLVKFLQNNASEEEKRIAIKTRFVIVRFAPWLK